MPTAEKGVASGVATLDAQSKIPTAQLPDLSDSYAGIPYADKIALVATVERYPALDPTGVGNSHDAIQQAIFDCPPDGEVVLPSGTYRCSGSPISNLASGGGRKSVTFSGYGATIIHEGTSSLFAFQGAFEANLEVSAVTPGTVTDASGNAINSVALTLDQSPSWIRGDVVKLFADDVIVGARPGTGGLEPRVGQFFTVFSVGGTTVTLLGALRDPFTANIKVSRLPQITAKIRGLTVDTTQAVLAGGSVAGYFSLTALVRPSLDDVTVVRSPNAATAINSCYMPTVNSYIIGFAVDDPGVSRYGYGIVDNASHGLRVNGISARMVRHAYTNDCLRIAAGTPTPYSYGRTFGATILNGICDTPSAVAWDTHHGSESTTFVNCRAVNARGAFSLRGRRHSIEAGKATGCNRDVHVFTEAVGGESWGHTIDIESVNNSYRVIDVDVNGAGHPSAGTIEERYTTIKRLAATGVQKQILTLSNARVRLEGTPCVEMAASVNTGSQLIYVSNSTLQATTLTLDFVKNSSGTGIDVFGSNTGLATVLDIPLVRIYCLSGHSSSISRVVRGVPNLRTDMTVKISYRLTGASIMADGLSSGSIFEWYSENNQDNSDYYLATGSALGQTAATTWIRQTRGTRLTLDAQPGGGNFKLQPIPTGKRRGQQLTIMNTSTVGSITIPHGGDHNTTLVSGSDTTLNPGSSMVLVWLVSTWRQIS
ncbi:hypothetical protein [Arthrobacter sp. S39]|uniref:hypothetical protein n=1 Tax=Arthrobacter sp. S39 TaxID=2509720 RepID=UPI0010381B86|nr:hypothetical protein [Arthrobacter sp. S39]TAP45174.1 hypothetical protein EYS21_00030 [Arthrobacter sp. S39]